MSSAEKTRCLERKKVSNGSRLQKTEFCNYSR